MVGKREISDEIIFVAFKADQNVPGTGVPAKRIVSLVYGQSMACDVFITAGQIETDMTGAVMDSGPYFEHEVNEMSINFHARAGIGYAKVKERVYSLTPLRISRHFRVPENRGLMGLVVLKKIYDDYLAQGGEIDSGFVRRVAGVVKELGDEISAVLNMNEKDFRNFEALFDKFWNGVSETRQPIFSENIDLSDLRNGETYKEQEESDETKTVKAEILRFLSFIASSRFLVPESDGENIENSKKILLKVVKDSGKTKVVSYEQFRYVDGIHLLRHYFKQILEGIPQTELRKSKTYFPHKPSFFERKILFNLPHFKPSFCVELESVLVPLLYIYDRKQGHRLLDFLKDEVAMREVKEAKVANEGPKSRDGEKPTEQEARVDDEEEYTPGLGMDFDDFVDGGVNEELSL